jgi:hypothetical protein
MQHIRCQLYFNKPILKGDTNANKSGLKSKGKNQKEKLKTTPT